MAGKKLSFHVLGDQSDADPPQSPSPTRKKRKHKKKKDKPPPPPPPPLHPLPETGVPDAGAAAFFGKSTARAAALVAVVSAVTTAQVAECQTVYASGGCGELRQRNVAASSSGWEETAPTTTEEGKAAIEESGEAEEEQPQPQPRRFEPNGTGLEAEAAESLDWNKLMRAEDDPQRRSEPNGSVVKRLETADSLDWKKLMAEDPNYLFSVEQSPMKYFLDEMSSGNSLRSTTTLGSEKERERVYNTIFHLPWRCEWLIDVGFFVCLDSFLSLLTIMPTRILTTLWRLLNTRQFKKLSATELSDAGCFIVLASGVALLERTDISLIYHMIRGQGTIKLYVVYNVLEIFDKLCQNFGGDVLQTLFNSSEGLANSSPENMRFWIWRFISDQALAIAFSNILMLALFYLYWSCIVAHNNALLALLVSNNFAEIKSSVFKRFSKDNIHSLVYSDSVERFHISAFLLFVLAQNILEAEGPWFENFLSNALMVFFCEMLIDIIKHSFLAKFNDIKPIAYSEFLEELCNQTLNIQIEDKKKILTFVPLAPACVVIRVLTPVYAAHLPYGPFIWRFFWIVILSAMTYVMLTSLKVMIGMGLQKHATWYINRCRRKKHHLHAD
ncbi:Protein POLLEN DEFTIVE IN GUIDANCE 1 [Turnera subulata]|uniref:Protein POLLEN DEFTIVE IN GUIDANCE 1 n=1 Tax=Turnera subulata TaxID=218843 RepID=A0A9Q0JE12_9ROSI|nr:Protein POLLEN DEFTIVE IN GUIDANCE 1 [Turnera subulata]